MLLPGTTPLLDECFIDKFEAFVMLTPRKAMTDDGKANKKYNYAGMGGKGASLL
jgi:hypothetical protein